MFKIFGEFIDRTFVSKQKKAERNIPLYNHLKLAGYSQEEVSVIINHYKFLKIEDKMFYIYNHTFTKKNLEITTLGNLCSGQIDLYDHKMDVMSW